MIIYILVFGLLLAFTSLSYNKKHTALATLLFFGICVLFICFRFETGNDWPIYKRAFLDINFNNNFIPEIFRLSKTHAHEPFFVVIVYIIKYITNNLFFVDFLAGIFILYSYYSLAKQYKINTAAFVFVLLLFLVFTVHFSLIRQSIAIAFFNLGIIYWQKKNIKLVSLMFFLAFLFHNTVVLYIGIFLAAIIITKLYKRKIPYIIYGILCLIYFLPKGIILQGEHRLIKKINFYFNHLLYTDPLKTIYLLSLYGFIILLAFKTTQSIKKEHLWKLNYLLISVVLSIAFYNITGIRERTFYQLIIILVLYCFILKEIKTHQLIINSVVLFFGISMLLSNLIKPTKIAWLPYQSYFNVWMYNDYGNGKERQDYKRFLYNYKYKKERAIKQNKLQEFLEKEKALKQAIKRSNTKKHNLNQSCPK